MKLLRELSSGDIQNNLKSSDSSAAGSQDVNNTIDVKFSLMRNMINSQKGMTGSDINDYLERAHELNDEVDTVGFAIETEDGDLIKVYVNAMQADEFEQELSTLLGVDDDSEVAINRLASKYDIVDVVWPTDNSGEPVDGSALNPEDGVSIDDDLSSFMGDDETSSNPETAADDAGEETVDTDDLADALPADDESEEDESEDEASEDEPDESSLSGADAESDDTVGPETIDDDEASEEADEDEDDAASEEDASDGDDEEGTEAGTSEKSAKKKSGKKPNKEVTEEGITMKLNLIASLAEAAEGSEGAENVSVRLDTPWKGIYSVLRRPYEKKIIELFSLLGVPGRYVQNAEGFVEAVRAAGDIIRRPGRKQNAFNDFFGAVQSLALTESKKRGGHTQKLLETVMITLGFPVELVTVEGGSPVASVLAKTAGAIESDSNAEFCLISLAKAFGITTQQVEESVRADEEVDVGNDEFAQAVMNLVLALGIPESVLASRRTVIAKALREKKMSLTNKTMVEYRIDNLVQLIKKGTKQSIAAPQNESLTEGFKDLEAMDNFDLRKFQVEEPHAGPALFAAYDGSGAHAETCIILAADPDAADNESLYVAVSSPWADKDEIKRTKHFTNDKAGYNQAKAYAEQLRTMNPKLGGRPKGWKE